MSKLKALAVKAAHLILSPQWVAVEKPILRAILLRYGVSAASLGAGIAVAVQKLLLG